jgi:hypothetical protein
MALDVLSPPPASLAALAPILGPAPAAHANALRALVADATPDHVTLPTPVYVLGLDSLINGRGLADARLVGWRYIIDKGTGATVAAEVGYDHGTAQHAFSSLNQGSFVDDTPVQVSAAQRAPEVASGDYELRLLRIPALYLVALWLKDRNGTEDRLVPLAPSQPPLTAGRIYPVAEVEKLLEPQAADRLKFDDRPKP